MDESDVRETRAPAADLVNQAVPRSPKSGEMRVDVGDLEGDVVKSWAAGLEELIHHTMILHRIASPLTRRPINARRVHWLDDF